VYSAARGGHMPTRRELQGIEAQDILKSSVFDADTGS
jgi:hypothetical protein